MTIRFQEPLNPYYHYYFLINYDQSQGPTGNKNASGPLAVFTPPLTNSPTNGFAASSTGNATAGFTDFVRFEGNAYTLWHVSSSDPTGRTFLPEGQPLNPGLPTPTNPVLTFDIDLSQFVIAASPIAMAPSDVENQARNIQYLQVNIVATNYVPTDTMLAAYKEADSLGDTQSPTGRGSFLSLDVLHATVFNNSNNTSASAEPSYDDVWTSDGSTGEESLDIRDYSITVTTP